MVADVSEHEAPRAGDRRRRDPAIAHAHAAMASMLRLGISPTPENYLVWFSFHGDQQSPVRDLLGGRLAEGAALGEQEMRELYDDFFASAQQSRQVSDLSARLGDTLRDAAGIVTGAMEDAGRYGTSLRTFSNALEKTSGRVPPLVQHLMQETQTLRNRGTAMAAELSDTAGKIDVLRRELDEARRDATTDPLTGLSNRRAFDAAMDAALNASTAMAPPCLLLIDLDHFKGVNDRHGHAVGDAVLRQVAATLRAACRPGQVAARLGGEEFAIVLPDVAVEHARDLAERIRMAIERTALSAGDTGGATFSVTTSVGVARATKGESAERLLARADAALYAAKRAGRNQVRLDP